MADLIAGIETGGTKVVCALAPADDPRRIIASETLPTTTPSATLTGIIRFLRSAQGEVRAVGIASFGPLDLDPQSPGYGQLTSTPKLGWSGVNILGVIGSALSGAPTAVVSDVTGSALGEARWGAGVAVDDFAYLTVGTGVGAGLIHESRTLSGSGWPEIAHLLPRRHPDDNFAGVCPFHGDCIEGLVSGPAILQRWGHDGSHLRADQAELNLRLCSYYLGQLVTTLAYTLGTRLVILGGGVSKTAGIRAAIESQVRALMGRDGSSGTSGGPVRIVPPGLGDSAGVLGALSLADRLLTHEDGVETPSSSSLIL